MTLATATPDGKPSVRVVLLKGYDASGFVFYTNLESRKSRELLANPFAALCFYWEMLSYQVRIEGKTRPVPEEEADTYFQSRPRGSQIGAWASKQSRHLGTRTELNSAVSTIEARFSGRDIPRPEFWGGFKLIPDRYEFWKRGSDRLHERTLYRRIKNNWDVSLLYP
jgi:pyridoxamine 5'-phosphate oxidase